MTRCGNTRSPPLLFGQLNAVGIIRLSAGCRHDAYAARHKHHTFCSHLVMRGGPARAIQELAGHRDLMTTQRYMRLSLAALDSAIRLRESPGIPRSFGDILETAGPENRKSNP
jgi:hypothetical protein